MAWLSSRLILLKELNNGLGCEKEPWYSTRGGIKEVDECVILKAQYYEHLAEIRVLDDYLGEVHRMIK
jgi:hypothetical protein